ncbi:glycoside hydrolase, partial [Coprinellus micaceus]
SLLSALLLQASHVLGHGYVSKVTIGGKSYTGLAPFEGGARGSSAVRQIQSTSPVMPASNPQLACGSSNSPASLIADAQPGDTVSFKWVGQGGINWIHKVGPILTYMASCGTSPCSQFDTSSAQWFKISELTKKPSGEWYMADVFAGGETTTRIPSTLKAGNYLIRSELIAIHNAVTRGGAEYFPSCTQLRVGGSQSGVPAQGDLVKFPGAYKDSDPGVFVPDLFQPGFKYTAPGPAVAKIAKGSGGGESNPAPSSTKDASTSTRAPSSSTSA